MTIWSQLDNLNSKGSTVGKAGSLGALHAHRQLTLSQFFTPKWVVDHIWSLLSHAFKDNERYSLFDNSVGAASMFRNAVPEIFELHGLDIDSELIQQVVNTFSSTSFKTNFRSGSICDVRLGKFSVSMINPPFSIQLSSQSLVRYEGITHFGALGADTSALSHEYALAQALAHSDVVAALVPASTTKKLLNGDFDCIDSKRLRAILHLPRNTFEDESVELVNTDVLIFSKSFNSNRPAKFYQQCLVERAITPESVPERLKELTCRPVDSISNRNTLIEFVKLTSSLPSITTPVTGDTRVILRRAGRNIKLKFFDGATEAKVLNRLMGQKLQSSSSHRYPLATKYEGQYKLSLDVFCLQDEPLICIDNLCAEIEAYGAKPEVDRQLKVGFERIVLEHTLRSTAFSRTAYRKGLPTLLADAKRTHLINRTLRASIVTKGEAVTANRTSNGYEIITNLGSFDCSAEHFFGNFSVSDEAVDSGYWEDIAPPLKLSFPTLFAGIEAKAKAQGIDKFLTMDYQFDDACELAAMGAGICGWQMALGKTRLEISLALMLEGSSLIVLKSRLIDEMMKECDALGIARETMNVINSVSTALSLSKINLISYETIRRAVDRKCPKFTYAHLIKNKIANIFVDEGGCLSNSHSQQAVAIARVNAKRRYILDGTPSPNYPREMLGLLHFASNGPKSYMPYSNDSNGICFEKRLITSAQFQPTGRKEFLDKFSTFEWATNEFFDTGVGAKREVPKIKQQNLNEFRTLISPFLKRRVQQEPAVSKYIKFPVPQLHEPLMIDWDFHHLVQYVTVVEEFANWYKSYMEQMQDEKKTCSLVIILAKLEACFKSCNTPSTLNSLVAKSFNDLTSKERASIELIKSVVAEGRRPILFARNPIVLHRLSKQLNNAGITNLVFTGEESITKRTERLNAEIRQGDVQVMLASSGVTQDGLNLHELNTFIFYNRSYTSRVEFQSIYRLVRPKQKSNVEGYFLHLEGSIDQYMGQMIEWKQLASEAGLDYGEQPQDKEFKHFEFFISAFLDSLPALKDKIRLVRDSSRAA
jgi:hypothetical protein